MGNQSSSTVTGQVENPLHNPTLYAQNPFLINFIVHFSIDSHDKLSFQLNLHQAPENSDCPFYRVEDLYIKVDQHLNGKGQSKSPILYFQSVNSNLEALDYFLTQRQLSLSLLASQRVNQMELRAFSNPNQQVKSLSLQDFTLVKVLGEGGFSSVKLARCKHYGRLFAIKSICKKSIDDELKARSVLVERQILSTVSHPSIVKMHAYFETKKQHHYILDFCPGGELYFHLRKLGKVPEQVAKSIIAQAIVSLDYLHSQNICYRDLKPENILIDLQGYIKITDFGLSKINCNRRTRTFSFCGSLEYLSPEMISYHMDQHMKKKGMISNNLKLNTDGHGLMVDYYSLGVLMYEMVVGMPPFQDTDKFQMFNKILFTEPKFPSSVSKSTQEFILGLLQKDPTKRLGSHFGFSELIKHPYFKGYDFNRIKQRTLPIDCLLRPDLTSSNFKHYHSHSKFSSFLDLEEITQKS